MNYRIRSKISYLFKARHRRGHGIHSPFLFRFVTEVMENDGFFSAYPKLAAAEQHVRGMLSILNEKSWQVPVTTPKGTPVRLKRSDHLLSPPFNRLLFRLVNEFSPSRISFFGNTFGVTLLALAIADSRIPLAAIVPNHSYRSFSLRVVEEFGAPNVEVREWGSVTDADFLVVQLPEDAATCDHILAQVLGNPAFAGVVVVCGIHTSRELESVWNNYKEMDRVRIALDLFDVGIFICKKGLQKEEFVVRF
jgi:hypothetical protein